jgi:hypothetical protein
MSDKLLKLAVYLSGIFPKAHAQTGNQGVTLTNPLGGQSFTDVVQKVTNFFSVITIPIVAIMVLIGGFQMITAAGNPEKFSAGKKTIIYAAVGFAVILAADTVVTLIKNILGAK